MKLNLICDPHIEFGSVELPGGDTLLLAGDVCVVDYLRKERTDKLAVKNQKKCADFFTDVSAKYNQAFYILGNHEHYHGIFGNTIHILKDYLKNFKNISVLNNHIVPLTENTMLFGGTMWTNCKNNDYFVKQVMYLGMNDFRFIYMSDDPCLNDNHRNVCFHPNDTIVEFDTTILALKNALELCPDKKFVVMTHHAPCGKSCHPKFGDVPLNYAFYTNLENLILDNPQITHWFHGHTHDSHDYMIGTCRVVCNPRGYVGYEWNPNFQIDLEIEI